MHEHDELNEDLELAAGDAENIIGGRSKTDDSVRYRPPAKPAATQPAAPTTPNLPTAPMDPLAGGSDDPATRLLKRN